jgi:branched-chain amino acid transport system ATP-binding protein
MLTDKAKDLAAHLSGGQQQILGFARALILSPKLLLLDEPSLGVDPKTLDIILETVMQLKCEGVTIFVIEQNVRAALSIADRVYFLKDGEIVAEDSPLDIEEKLDFLLWNPLSPGPPSLG